MCWHCYDEWGCHGWHHYPGRCYGPRWRYYEEPPPEYRRESLEEEKRILESRLKDIEARLSGTAK